MSSPGPVHESTTKPTPVTTAELSAATAAASAGAVAVLQRLLPSLYANYSTSLYQRFILTMFVVIVAGRRRVRLATVGNYQWIIDATATAVKDTDLLRHVPPGVPDVGWIPGPGVPNVSPLLYDVNATMTMFNRVVRDRIKDSTEAMIEQQAAANVDRHIRMAQRNTIMQLVNADDRSLGWVRILNPSQNNCAFCITLASRGPVYKSQQAAAQGWHPNCGCRAIEVFNTKWWPGKDYSTDWAYGIYNDGASYGGGRPDIRKLRKYLDDNPHVTQPRVEPAVA